MMHPGRVIAGASHPKRVTAGSAAIKHVYLVCGNLSGEHLRPVMHTIPEPRFTSAIHARCCYID